MLTQSAVGTGSREGGVGGALCVYGGGEGKAYISFSAHIQSTQMLATTSEGVPRHIR